MNGVSAVLVTRGDVDLQPVLDSLAAVFDDIVVWNNAERDDMHVYGRYTAIREAKHPLIYTQDDDAVCPVSDLLAAYSGDGLLVNVPPGEKPWLAWGALFPASLPAQMFERYWGPHPFDLEFRRWSDVVFAHMAGWSEIDLGHSDLPWASAPNRMYHQPDHYVTQDAMRARVAAL